MNQNLVSSAKVSINAPLEKVWEALVKPEIIQKYMHGSKVVTDWKIGSPISWQGEYNGKPYEDKGKVLQFEENKIMQVTHFSPLMGQPDIPENYHTLTMMVEPEDAGTKLSLTQDKNASEDEVKHTTAFWQEMLETIKKLLEQ